MNGILPGKIAFIRLGILKKTSPFNTWRNKHYFAVFSFTCFVKFSIDGSHLDLILSSRDPSHFDYDSHMKSNTDKHQLIMFINFDKV